VPSRRWRRCGQPVRLDDRVGGSESARATSIIDRSSQVERRSKASGSPGEGLDPGPEHAERLLGGGERVGPAALAGEREGGALEDAGGPDRNLAPLVTGQVGELGQRLHRGHPRHGFKS
jgi:hypothetical protein